MSILTNDSSIPDFIFFWDKKSLKFKIEKTKKFNKNGIKFFHRNFHPKPKIINKENFMLITIGNPILGNRINYFFDYNFLIDEENIKKINGQFIFILIDKKKKRIENFQ